MSPSGIPEEWNLTAENDNADESSPHAVPHDITILAIDNKTASTTSGYDTHNSSPSHSQAGSEREIVNNEQQNKEHAPTPQRESSIGYNSASNSTRDHTCEGGVGSGGDSSPPSPSPPSEPISQAVLQNSEEHLILESTGDTGQRGQRTEEESENDSGGNAPEDGTIDTPAHEVIPSGAESDDEPDEDSDVFGVVRRIGQATTEESRPLEEHGVALSIFIAIPHHSGLTDAGNSLYNITSMSAGEEPAEGTPQMEDLSAQAYNARHENLHAYWRLGPLSRGHYIHRLLTFHAVDFGPPT